MKTREPKKGKGVPRETPEENSMAALQATLTSGLPDVDWRDLATTLTARGFFEMSMQQQEQCYVHLIAEKLEMPADGERTLRALANSPHEKVQGLTAGLVPLAFPHDIERQVQWLAFAGTIESTWAREWAQSVLHNMVIEHGLSTILPLTKHWVHEAEPAVRRLLIEALRPRGVMLAHIKALKEDPTPLKALLVSVLDDPSDYVRKAVANNLNDISKDNPDTLLAWATEWHQEPLSAERQWILTRGLRTLVHAGHPQALQLMGYMPADKLQTRWLDTLPATTVLNQLLPFALEITNTSGDEGLVLVRLIMSEPGKGNQRRQRSYAIWKGTIPPQTSKSIYKEIHFVDRNSQPKLAGIYHLRLFVNGVFIGERSLRFSP